MISQEQKLQVIIKVIQIIQNPKNGIDKETQSTLLSPIQSERPSVDNLDMIYTSASKVLLWSIEKNREDILNQLLDGAPDIDVNVRNFMEDTPLMLSISYDRIKMTSRLLTTPGVNVNAKNVDGQTAVNRAIENEFEIKHLKQLLKVDGIDVNTYDHLGITPLIAAIYNVHLEALQLLLAKPDIKVNQKDAVGYTPLMRVAHNARSNVCGPFVAELLKADGIDITITNNNGETALSLAESCGNAAAAKLIREALSERSTAYPAYFAVRGIPEKKATGPRVAKVVEEAFRKAQTTEEKKQLSNAVLQFSRYAVKHHRPALVKTAKAQFQRIR